MKVRLSSIILALVIFECIYNLNTNLKNQIDIENDSDTVVSSFTPRKRLSKKKTIKKVHRFIKNDKIPEMNNNNSDNKGNSYFTYFIFIPLVTFILIMTIVSIIGFLILIFNSTHTFTKKDSTNSIKNNLTKDEYNELLKIKQKIKSRMKSNLNAPPGNEIV